MRRRDFITLVGASAAVGGVPARRARAAGGQVPQVAYLDAAAKVLHGRIFQGLADRGYMDGKNIVVEWFTAPTKADLPAFAAKAIASAPAVILAGGPAAALAAAQLTKTIPDRLPIEL